MADWPMSDDEPHLALFGGDHHLFEREIGWIEPDDYILSD